MAERLYFWLTNGEESTELLDEVRGGKDRIGLTFSASALLGRQQKTYGSKIPNTPAKT